MDILAIAAVAFTLAGFVKGVVGFGFPIITLIILTLTIGLLDALAIVVIPTIVVNFWQASSGPYLADIVLAASLGRNDLLSMEHVRVSVSALVPSILGPDYWSPGPFEDR